MVIVIFTMAILRALINKKAIPTRRLHTSMTVRAKFRLDEQSNIGQGKKDGKTQIKSNYVFKAVQDDSPENKTFWEWTPGGTINLQCVNPEVLKEFEIGQEFYVDFTPVK